MLSAPALFVELLRPGQLAGADFVSGEGRLPSDIWGSWWIVLGLLKANAVRDFNILVRVLSREYQLLVPILGHLVRRCNENYKT